MASIHCQRMVVALEPRGTDFGVVRRFRHRGRYSAAGNEAAFGRSPLPFTEVCEPVIRTGPIPQEPARVALGAGDDAPTAVPRPAGWRKNDRVVYWGFALFGVKARWRRSLCVLRVVETAPLRVTDGSEVRRVKPWDLRCVRGDDLNSDIRG